MEPVTSRTFGLALLAALCLPGAARGAEGPGVAIGYAKGEVSILRAVQAGKPAEKVKAQKGDALRFGDTVRTGADGTCNADLSKGCTAAIAERSAVMIRQHAAPDGSQVVAVKLLVGRLQFRVTADGASGLMVETTAGLVYSKAGQFLVTHEPPSSDQRNGVTIVTLLTGTLTVTRADGGEETVLTRPGQRVVIAEPVGRWTKDAGKKIQLSVVPTDQLIVDRDGAPPIYDSQGKPIPPPAIERPTGGPGGSLDPKKPDPRVEDPDFVPPRPPPKPPPVSP